jgi:hypothetical protein
MRPERVYSNSWSGLLSLDLRGVRNTYFIDVSNIYIAKEPISEMIALQKKPFRWRVTEEQKKYMYIIL